MDAAAMTSAHARGRPWLAMAVLAVLALGATVFVAHRALAEASDIVVRGEADVLMSTVTTELADEGGVPTTDAVQRELEAHAGAGLRYVALLDREGRAVVEAGDAEMRDVRPRPGRSEVSGRRVRVVGPLFPPRRSPRSARPFGGPLLLAIELEPPVIEKLRSDLTRISIVGAAAGAILLAFAVAWSRSAARLAAVERKAARDERLVALGAMSSVMAHELRNPLASLKGHAQLLAEDLEDDKRHAKAERVVRDAERLEVLTTSLLDFVRDGPMERAPIAPAELAARALEDLPKERVDVDVKDAPAELFADAGRLSRAVHNLVDNAIQASPDGGRVDLRIARDGEGRAVIEVRDRGPGIPAGSEAQIFEPFHTTRTRGTGLGLAVARRIAEQHDGSLACDNHPDGGARFRLRLSSERA